jgi:hypothetical protein
MGSIPHVMRAVRLQVVDGRREIAVEEIETPQPRHGETLVRVHAAAITRDELDWPADRFQQSRRTSSLESLHSSRVTSRTSQLATLSSRCRRSIVMERRRSTSQSRRDSSPRSHERSITRKRLQSPSPHSAPGRGCSIMGISLRASGC